MAPRATGLMLAPGPNGNPSAAQNCSQVARLASITYRGNQPTGPLATSYRRSIGYREAAAFSGEPCARHWFVRPFPASARPSQLP